jgi:DNA-directed RNA polymerase subunit E'/Rpb7
MNSNIYTNNVLYKKIIISPKYLSKNIEKYIVRKLKYQCEGKCIREGYVLEDSINIIRRSVGKTYGCDFSGNITYDVVYGAKICNPFANDIIYCVVKNINKLGILGENGPLSIIIAKQYHTDKSIFKNIEIGDYINIKVLGKKYELNDIKISVIGQIVKDGKIKIKKKIKIVQDNQNIEPSNDKVKSNIEFETNVPIIDIANEDESNDFSDSNPESDSDPEEYLEDSDDDFE